MANLVEVAEELEYVPKDQLIQMAQDPSSRFPSYLVLSEIQRRTQMERMYNADRMERPTSTVAEELVGEFSQPQGLAGVSAEGLGPLPNDFSLSAAPASSPMQMAAIGGRTGYQNLGRTGYINNLTQNLGYRGDVAPPYAARMQLLASLGINPSGMSEEEIQQALLFATQEQPEQAPLPQVDTGVDRPVDLRSVESAPVDEPGFFERAGDAVKRAGSAVSDFASDRYYDEEGDFNLGTAALDATLLLPGLGLAGAGLRGGLAGARGLLGAARSGEAARKVTSGAKTIGEATVKGAQATGKGLTDLAKASITKPKKISVKDPTPQILGGKGGKSAAAELGYVTPKGLSGRSQLGNVVQPRQLSAGRSAITGTVLGGAQVLKEMTLDDPTQTGVQPPVSPQTGADNQIIEEKIKQITGGEDNKANKGLLGKINSYMDQADGLDIAKLGGIIMGAKNMSELGAGITALASDVQDRKTAEQAREDTLKLQGIQGDLYKAQTEKYEADVENMPYDRLVAEFNAVADAYKLLAEQGDPSDPELAEYATYLGMLRKQMAAIRGIETNEQSDADLLAAAGISVSG
tara:strand:- start:16128 stop:17858 length:1731 start_codon:yes stop_codon:yes gene_type:complete